MGLIYQLAPQWKENLEPYYLEYVVELYVEVPVRERTADLLSFGVCKKMTCTAPAFLLLTVFCWGTVLSTTVRTLGKGDWMDKGLFDCLPGLFLAWRKQQV